MAARSGTSIRWQRARLLAVAALATQRCARAFTYGPAFSALSTAAVARGTTNHMAAADAEATAADPLGLTPELRRVTNAFASIPDEKMRYKQLLFMATQLAPISKEAMVPENKVPGCLSTVYVDAVAEMDEERGEEVVKFFGESDGLLTKGLVALLVRGLSGCTAEEVQRVNPEFIHEAKISQSLTPGRNNGFLNMLAVMKKKAADVAEGNAGTAGAERALEEEVVSEGGDNVPLAFEEIEGKPMYNAIMAKLTATLKPTAIALVDNSDQHAGHAGSKGWEESGESHFSLDIVADAFDGLSLVKRHQLVYMLLGDVMQKIHALQIAARTPEEVESS